VGCSWNSGEFAAKTTPTAPINAAYGNFDDFEVALTTFGAEEVSCTVAFFELDLLEGAAAQAAARPDFLFL
jgi:hypothetical protein